MDSCGPLRGSFPKTSAFFAPQPNRTTAVVWHGCCSLSRTGGAFSPNHTPLPARQPHLQQVCFEGNAIMSGSCFIKGSAVKLNIWQVVNMLVWHKVCESRCASGSYNEICVCLMLAQDYIRKKMSNERNH